MNAAAKNVIPSFNVDGIEIRAPSDFNALTEEQKGIVFAAVCRGLLGTGDPEETDAVQIRLFRTSRIICVFRTIDGSFSAAYEDTH